GKNLGHYNRTTTVRSDPGYVWPTESTEIVSFAAVGSPPRVSPLMAGDAGAPAAIVSVHHAAPFTLSWMFTGASGTVPTTPDTSRTACAASVMIAGAADCCTARYPST